MTIPGVIVLLVVLSGCRHHQAKAVTVNYVVAPPCLTDSERLLDCDRPEHCKNHAELSKMQYKVGAEISKILGGGPIISDAVVRIDREQEDAIQAIAARHGQSHAEVVFDLVREAQERAGATARPIEECFAEIIKEKHKVQ